MTWRGFSTTTWILVCQPAAFSFWALSSRAFSVDFFASVSSMGERTKKKGSTAEIRLNSESLGQGRETTSWMEISDASEPSSAIIIFMRTPAGTHLQFCYEQKDKSPGVGSGKK